MSTSVIGTPFWATHIAGTCLDERFNGRAISRFGQALRQLPALLTSDRVIVLGHGLPDTAARKIWFMLVWVLWATSRKRHVVFYWIGSEVYRTPQPNLFTRAYLRLARHKRVHHICGAAWFVPALQSVGIDATEMLFPYDTDPARAHANDWPDTAQLRIVTYLTPSHWANSNGAWIADAARDYPDVAWTVIGMSAQQAPDAIKGFPNITWQGWVDNPVHVMAQGHVFVRLTQRDAYAGTVRDAQAMRRIVIFTKPVSDAVVVDTNSPTGFQKAFADIAAAFASGSENRITALRATGATLPDCNQSAQALSDFMVNPT